MFKKITVVTLISLSLAACTTNSDVVSSSQAQRVQTVSYGTLMSVRPVQIQDEQGAPVGAIGGAVLGGVIGNTIGGGRGRNVGTAAGAIGGAMAGNAVQNAMNRTDGFELEVRREDNGQTIVVVQRAGSMRFTPGQRVAIATSSNGVVTVSPR